MDQLITPKLLSRNPVRPSVLGLIPLLIMSNKYFKLQIEGTLQILK